MYKKNIFYVQEEQSRMYEKNIFFVQEEIWIEQENLYKINFPATTKKMTQLHNGIVH